MSQGQEIKSVKRAVDLLHTFSPEEPELSVASLSRRLGVHKSTVYRLLSTLEADGLIDCNPQSGHYRLGMGILELAGLVVLHADLRKVARPMLRQLASKTQETVDLAVCDRDEAINIEQAVPHNRRVLNIGWVGRRTPLHASSTGKVLLAFLPKPQVNALFQKPLTRFTEHTLTDIEALRTELASVRQQGYAAGLEELEIGLNAVAAPVRDHNDQVIAAVSVAGPCSRLSQQRIEEEAAAQVTVCAQEISHALGLIEEDKPSPWRA